METILPSEFQSQMVLLLDGAPHVIEEMHTSGTAQTRHKTPHPPAPPATTASLTAFSPKTSA